MPKSCPIERRNAWFLVMNGASMLIGLCLFIARNVDSAAPSSCLGKKRTLRQQDPARVANSPVPIPESNVRPCATVLPRKTVRVQPDVTPFFASLPLLKIPTPLTIPGGALSRQFSPTRHAENRTGTAERRGRPNLIAFTESDRQTVVGGIVNRVDERAHLAN